MYTHGKSILGFLPVKLDISRCFLVPSPRPPSNYVLAATGVSVTPFLQHDSFEFVYVYNVFRTHRQHTFRNIINQLYNTVNDYYYHTISFAFFSFLFEKKKKNIAESSTNTIHCACNRNSKFHFTYFTYRELISKQYYGF